ncbi:MAG TPA: outer membrane beta-barrel protein, partial [Polyangiaceae bacterium]|nr:outer membrane beta-barrel protein [Polyangiaceae bacterium]
INQQPSGPGTERVSRTGRPLGVHEGAEVSAAIGSGFTDTYGLGLEGRLGYTFARGVYAGGDLQYFVGQSVNGLNAHATFLGGELGYKFFPSRRIEIRPYAFLGPAWITEVHTNPVESVSKVDLGVQPGVLAAYHFGDVFLGADAHYMLTPTPNTLAVTANAGLGF